MMQSKKTISKAHEACARVTRMLVVGNLTTADEECILKSSFGSELFQGK